MTVKALQDLETITDLLGPGLWLQVEETHLARCFGMADPVTGATVFAKQRGCIFLPDRKRRGGRFGRGYFKTDADKAADSG